MKFCESHMISWFPPATGTRRSPSQPGGQLNGRLLQRHQHGADRYLGGRDLRLHVAEAPGLLDPGGTHCGVQPAQVPGMKWGGCDGDDG